MRGGAHRLFVRVHITRPHRRTLDCSQPGTVIPADTQRNRILATLPRKRNRAFHAALTAVQLPFGEVLYQARTANRHVYFPDDCTVSLLAVADRTSGLEVGLVGSEGMVGIPVALGAGLSPVRALVQGAGSARRMSSTRFSRELKRNRPLQRTVERCAHVAMATAMQVAVCNNEHLLEARLARWLLMSQDRSGSDTFQCTQQTMAHMLGVRRVGVSVAASALQRRGLIAYKRAAMRILDRAGLLAAACSCYAVLRRLDAA